MTPAPQLLEREKEIERDASAHFGSAQCAAREQITFIFYVLDQSIHHFFVFVFLLTTILGNTFYKSKKNRKHLQYQQ